MFYNTALTFNHMNHDGSLVTIAVRVDPRRTPDLCLWFSSRRYRSAPPVFLPPEDAFDFAKALEASLHSDVHLGFRVSTDDGRACRLDVTNDPYAFGMRVPRDPNEPELLVALLVPRRGLRSRQVHPAVMVHSDTTDFYNVVAEAIDHL